MSKLDLTKFHDCLWHDMKFTAGRVDCLLDLGPESRDKPDVVGAAILISALTHLRNYACLKVLGPKDLQVAINAALEGARVEDYESTMGEILFRRKETA